MRRTRRRFLQTALTVPIAGLLDAGRSLLAGASVAAQEQALFESPLIIKYDAHCFVIQGRDAFVFGAAFHYPRCPKALWHGRLAQTRQEAAARQLSL